MANGFLQGTLILTIAGFVVKAIGSINWIILSRILNGEGIGIYLMAFPIYLLALQVSSAGIPVAISIITAEKAAQEDYSGAHRVFKIALALLTATGFILSALVWFGADWLIEYHIIKESRAYYSILALSPAIFFVTLISCFRGYLQGWQIMTPTALSQIVEQLVRVVVMLWFASYLLPYGLEYAAGGASLGAGAGAFAALLILLYYYWKLQRSLPQTPLEKFSQESAGTILTRIAELAIPISMASILLPLVSNLDLLIVPRRLEAAGFSTAEATELFGYLTGMAVPLINLATIITAAMATSLVPAISNANALHDKAVLYSRTSESVRLSFLATIPFAMLLYVLAEPVVTFIYNAPAAAQATQILSWAIFLLGLHQVTTGILQGLGKPKIPVVNMAISAAIKVAMNWFLTAVPWLGIAGAAYATVADIGFAAALNLYFIYKYTDYVFDIKSLLQNIVSAAVMGTAIYFLYPLLTQTGSLFISLAAAAILGMGIYIAVMILCGGTKKEELQKLPFVSKFVK